MSNWHITIIARDVNGNWSEYNFDNIDEFRDAYHKKSLKLTIMEEDEILFVKWGDSCIYNGLTSDKPITIEEIGGFFA